MGETNSKFRALLLIWPLYYKTRRAIEAEEEGRKRTVHAAAEGETMVGQGQDVGPRRDRRHRRDPVCWGVESWAMCLGSAHCGMTLRRIARGSEKGMWGGLKTHYEGGVKLEREPLGTYVAPTRILTSGVIYEEIVVAGVVVRALVDTGASTSCCTRKWYQRYQHEVEPLLRDATKIVGVGNIPINVDGRTSRLPLVWNDAKSFLTLLVIPTLEEPDMILGMDVIQRLGVRIDTKTGTAQPTMLVTKIKPEESWMVPAQTSVVFSIKNPYGEQEKKILFDPSEKLPQVLRGMTSLEQGQWLYVRLENTGEDDQVLDPNWEIGTVEVVKGEPDFPAGKEEEE